MGQTPDAERVLTHVSSVQHRMTSDEVSVRFGVPSIGKDRPTLTVNGVWEAGRSMSSWICAELGVRRFRNRVARMCVADTCIAAAVYAVVITSAEGTNVGTAGFVAMREHRRGVSGNQRRRNDGHFGKLLEVAKVDHLILHQFGFPDGCIRPSRMPLDYPLSQRIRLRFTPLWRSGRRMPQAHLGGVACDANGPLPGGLNRVPPVRDNAAPAQCFTNTEGVSDHAA